MIPQSFFATEPYATRTRPIKSAIPTTARTYMVMRWIIAYAACLSALRSLASRASMRSSTSHTIRDASGHSRGHAELAMNLDEVVREVAERDSCDVILDLRAFAHFVTAGRRQAESRHGTHECARHMIPSNVSWRTRSDRRCSIHLRLSLVALRLMDMFLASSRARKGSTPLARLRWGISREPVGR